MTFERGLRRSLAFVVPALDGPVSGGTLYNRELLAALAEHADVRAVAVDREPRALGDSPFVWVDSLFLAQAPELKQRLDRRIAILLHYLPSFVALGRAAAAVELSEVERAALTSADALWVPSAFMRDALEPIVAPTQKIHVLEPGTRACLRPARTRTLEPLRAVCIGNVTPGKGYWELLNELGKMLEPSDRCELTIVGSLAADKAYAEACTGAARAQATLAGRVRFTGELSPEAALEELAGADLFVSASRMESYGMALAEARASGVPIVALDRGNARAHVHAGWGGKLAENQADLAAQVLALAREPQRLSVRRVQARAHAPSPRPWSAVAREFLNQLERCEK